eukprot:scaffold4635_cov267-Pinguiococcus_pyrenoidosus.AAC.27
MVKKSLSALVCTARAPRRVSCHTHAYTIQGIPGRAHLLGRVDICQLREDFRIAEHLLDCAFVAAGRLDRQEKA